jgi:hypothetical protein
MNRLDGLETPFLKKVGMSVRKGVIMPGGALPVSLVPSDINSIRFSTPPPQPLPRVHGGASRRLSLGARHQIDREEHAALVACAQKRVAFADQRIEAVLRKNEVRREFASQQAIKYKEIMAQEAMERREVLVKFAAEREARQARERRRRERNKQNLAKFRLEKEERRQQMLEDVHAEYARCDNMLDAPNATP